MITRSLSLAVLLGTALALNAQDWAKPRLEKSPRHLEWVKVKNGTREVSCFIAYPEVKDKATAVIVIHEIFGLSDWVRGVTDQLAEAGTSPSRPICCPARRRAAAGRRSWAAGMRCAKAISSLPPDQITADLKAVAEYVTKLPAANGKLAVGGFCWGGGQTFRFATNAKGIQAAFVFYGTGPGGGGRSRPREAPVYWLLRRQRQPGETRPSHVHGGHEEGREGL